MLTARSLLRNTAEDILRRHDHRSKDSVLIRQAQHMASVPAWT